MNKYKCLKCEAICNYEYCRRCGNKEYFKLRQEAKDLFDKGFSIKSINLSKPEMLEAMGRV